MTTELPSATPSLPASKRRRRRSIVACLVVLAVAVAAVIKSQHAPALPEGLSEDDYRAAQRRFLDLVGVMPERSDALLIAGELAVSENRWTQALACFQAVPTEAARSGRSARLQEAQVLIRLNRAADAERAFQIYFAMPQQRPNRETLAGAYKWLNFVLSAELRFEDRQKLLREVHKLGLADVLDSKQLHFPNLLIWNSSLGRKRCSDFVGVDPQNLDLLVAQGRYLTAEGRLDEARPKFEQLLQRHPGNVKVLAGSMELDFERNDWPALLAREKTLPIFDPGEPWLLTRMRGELALHQQNWQSAVEHFQQVVRADPANPWSQVGLARAFGELGRTQEQAEARQRSGLLAKIRVGLVKVNDRDAEAAIDLADQCSEAGLTEAAEAFRDHARQMKAMKP